MTERKPSLDEIQAARGKFLPDILGPDRREAGRLW